jgi:hypothetical protein
MVPCSAKLEAAYIGHKRSLPAAPCLGWAEHGVSGGGKKQIEAAVPFKYLAMRLRFAQDRNTSCDTFSDAHIDARAKARHDTEKSSISRRKMGLEGNKSRNLSRSRGSDKTS